MQNIKVCINLASDGCINILSIFGFLFVFYYYTIVILLIKIVQVFAEAINHEFHCCSSIWMSFQNKFVCRQLKILFL